MGHSRRGRGYRLSASLLALWLLLPSAARAEQMFSTAQQGGAAPIEAIRADYHAAIDFLRRADAGLERLPAGNACADMQSAESLFRSVAADSRSLWRNFSLPEEVRRNMLEISTESLAYSREIQSAHTAYCTPQRTVEEQQQDRLAAQANSAYLSGLFEKLEVTEDVWKALNGWGAPEEPVAVRQFIASIHPGSPYYDKAVKLLQKLEAKQAARVLKNTPVAANPAAVLPEPGGAFRDCAFCPEMVVVPDDQQNTGYQRHPVPVTLRHALAIGVSEVTRGQWRACVDDGACPSAPLDDEAPGLATDQHPVTRVTYQEALDYAAWLTRVTGQPYDIPSEMEWEFAGGGMGEKNSGEGNGWNYSGKTGKDIWLKTSPVGYFGKDKNGTVDMLGNVAEWVQGCYFPNYDNVTGDGKVRGDPATCDTAPVKGSGFGIEEPLRLSGSVEGAKDIRHPGVGLRVVRRGPRAAKHYPRVAAPELMPEFEAFSMELPKTDRFELPPKQHAWKTPTVIIKGARLDCRIFMLANYFGGGPGDPYFTLASNQAFYRIHGNGYTFVSKPGKVIDGANTWSGTMNWLNTPYVFHIRHTPGKPTLAGYCEPGGDPLETEAILSTLRWKGESTAGVAGVALDSLPDISPDVAEGWKRLTFKGDLLLFKWSRSKSNIPAEALETRGFSLVVPGADWAGYRDLLMKVGKISEQSLPECAVYDTPPLTQAQIDAKLAALPPGTEYRVIDGGVTVLAADGGSGERWIAGGRGLHISCWPRGEKAVIPGMRTMMATLRWADEAATDGERWWRKE
ncbi:MAG: formylglycine-generating enzyme family protein [Fluviicoccus sp.]|uniref:formylglycine-generating enzyme family protein n=1 Tax=Fluviicoccus sp. TaxID=2003552 RepID=UPI00272902C2|nr:formylglycine-generating enzyme family protein [Fluviicoccus sp.]MDO8332135.1 formylglycine-generating enzyme family protein [Fluviicoccus sp.]